jgi:hypothetical protein
VRARRDRNGLLRVRCRGARARDRNVPLRH